MNGKLWIAGPTSGSIPAGNRRLAILLCFGRTWVRKSYVPKCEAKTSVSHMRWCSAVRSMLDKFRPTKTSVAPSPFINRMRKDRRLLGGCGFEKPGLAKSTNHTPLTYNP
jgi:hypothetical protein